MVEVTIDSIRVSLMSQHRVAILKDVDGERFLPIWIGPCEADAITVRLQEVEVARPITQVEDDVRQKHVVAQLADKHVLHFGAKLPDHVEEQVMRDGARHLHLLQAHCNGVRLAWTDPDWQEAVAVHIFEDCHPMLGHKANADAIYSYFNHGGALTVS